MKSTSENTENVTGDRSADPRESADRRLPRKGPKTPATDRQVPELGGASGPEPTRYGDWERNGRCIDF